MADRPLHGLTIAVTRPREQAMKMVQRIEQAGGAALLFPLLEISAMEDADALNAQIARLGQFNLAIFISPNAVRYGTAAIRASGKLPQNLQIATVGQGSAKALRESGFSNIIAPSERFDSEGLLALPEMQHVSGWHVMIFRGDGGRELLGDTLRERGATVEYASCYRRAKSQQDKGKLLAARPDAIIVTSSEAMEHLSRMLDGSDRDALRSMVLFVPHARIAGLARDLGWPQVNVTAPGDEGLFSALTAWASQNTN
jgi:uroporphyrinogen-III synthase